MKIVKPINNNIVSALDICGNEIVVMGKGIGYKAKSGNEIDENMIEKVFYMENQDATDKLKKLLADVPLEYFQITDEIIYYDKKTLGKELNQTIYITLTDHINFAILRKKKGMMFRNALLLEVRRFYNEEFLVGKYAISLIKSRLKIDFPEDEAASIALHIVNAEYDTSLNATMDIARIAYSIMEYSFKQIKIKPNEQSVGYERFITYLKFLANRIVKQEQETYSDPKLNDVIAAIYPDEYICSKNIAKWIYSEYNFYLNNDEISHLTLHLKRNKEENNKLKII